FNRELVEWDMVFDDVDFNWSTTGDVNAMDFESISTHELGHAVGLADLYTSDCSEETMYGYATEGETKKRDLNSGDITGMSKLY
ncbi:MAG: matrixin family metalloprotease, partial [Candidatus Spechtbacterales bacterium]|nr:matrixin family metalloprotease [Candidatus Spechtbacterales bacterium]